VLIGYRESRILVIEKSAIRWLSILYDIVNKPMKKNQNRKKTTRKLG